MPDQPSEPETELDRIQRWFAAVITHPDGVTPGVSCDDARQQIDVGPGELEKIVTRSHALSAQDRLAVYANAYYARLLECLGDVFPVMKRAVGDEVFGGFAFGYLQSYPSRSYTLNKLGRSFTQYLSETRPDRDASGQPAAVDWPDFLIDLAALEWAIYEVFDGPGVEGQPLLGSADVLAVPPQRWPSARLRPVVCLRLMRLRYPVNDYYSAARRAPADQTVELPAPAETFVALTRRQYVVRRYELTRPQFQLLGALLEDQTVGDAIALAADACGPEVSEDQLAQDLRLWFRNWTAEGFFQSVALPT